MKLKKLHKIVLCFQFFSLSSFGGENLFLVGGALGFGGAGIKQTQVVDGKSIDAEKSEGPGVVSIFIENLLSDTSSFGFEHSRGFRLGPFSTGVSLTGMTHRFYLTGPAPYFPKIENGNNYIFSKQYVPYLGYGLGVATADVARSNDLTPSVTGSGVYLAFKGGMDYSMSPGKGMRYEIHYATTFMSAELPVTTVSEFALQVGWYFFWQ